MAPQEDQGWPKLLKALFDKTRSAGNPEKRFFFWCVPSHATISRCTATNSHCPKEVSPMAILPSLQQQIRQLFSRRSPRKPVLGSRLCVEQLEARLLLHGSP